jgi:hypothetical protein
MNREELEAVGRNHALEALDQVEAFKDRRDAIESYRENLWDTLIEMGCGDDADAVRAAEDAFELTLTR